MAKRSRKGFRQKLLTRKWPPNKLQVVVFGILAAMVGFVIYSSLATSYPGAPDYVPPPAPIGSTFYARTTCFSDAITADQNPNWHYGKVGLVAMNTWPPYSHYTDLYAPFSGFPYSPNPSSSGAGWNKYNVPFGTKWKILSSPNHPEVNGQTWEVHDHIGNKTDMDFWWPANKCGNNDPYTTSGTGSPPVLMKIELCRVGTSGPDACASSGGNKPTGPANFAYCASENGTCNLSGFHDIAYGGNGHYIFKSSYNGSTACNTSSFGGHDPLPGVVKECWAFHLPSAYVFCAHENTFCQFEDGLFNVVFGANGRYSTRRAIWGPNIACDVSDFGDPAVGYTKYCYYEQLTQANFACSSHPTVGYGYYETGVCVNRIQYILRKTSAYESNSGEDPGGLGGWGTHTYNAVVAFQKTHYKAGTNTKLSADGVVGPDTWGALEGQCGYMNGHARTSTGVGSPAC